MGEINRFNLISDWTKSPELSWCFLLSHVTWLSTRLTAFEGFVVSLNVAEWRATQTSCALARASLTSLNSILNKKIVYVNYWMRPQSSTTHNSFVRNRRSSRHQDKICVFVCCRLTVGEYISVPKCLSLSVCTTDTRDLVTTFSLCPLSRHNFTIPNYNVKFNCEKYTPVFST